MNRWLGLLLIIMVLASGCVAQQETGKPDQQVYNMVDPSPYDYCMTQASLRPDELDKLEVTKEAKDYWTWQIQVSPDTVLTGDVRFAGNRIKSLLYGRKPLVFQDVNGMWMASYRYKGLDFLDIVHIQDMDCYLAFINGKVQTPHLVNFILEEMSKKRHER